MASSTRQLQPAVSDGEIPPFPSDLITRLESICSTRTSHQLPPPLRINTPVVVGVCIGVTIGILLVFALLLLVALCVYRAHLRRQARQEQYIVSSHPIPFPNTKFTISPYTTSPRPSSSPASPIPSKRHAWIQPRSSLIDGASTIERGGSAPPSYSSSIQEPQTPTSSLSSPIRTPSHSRVHGKELPGIRSVPSPTTFQGY